MAEVSKKRARPTAQGILAQSLAEAGVGGLCFCGYEPCKSKLEGHVLSAMRDARRNGLAILRKGK